MNDTPGVSSTAAIQKTDKTATNNSFKTKPTKQAICQYFPKYDHVWQESATKLLLSDHLTVPNKHTNHNKSEKVKLWCKICQILLQCETCCH